MYLLIYYLLLSWHAVLNIKFVCSYTLLFYEIFCVMFGDNKLHIFIHLSSDTDIIFFY